MKVLVTGGSGTVGRRVIRDLLRTSGTEVFALVRASTNKSLIAQGATVVEGDLFRVETLYKVLEKVDVVIHLAAEMDFFPADPALLYRTNVEATKNLVQASARKGIKRFVYISSTEAIAAGHHLTQPLNEESPLGSNFDYGKSKILSETVVKDNCRETGMEYVIVRLCGIFNDTVNEFQLIWAVSIGLFFFVPGMPKQTGRASFMAVEDAASAIKLVASAPKAANETFIFASDAMSYEQIIRSSCRQLGRVQPFINLPLPIVALSLKLLAPFLRPWFSKKFAFEQQTLQEMTTDRWFSTDKAKTLLGWKPSVTMEEALEHSIAQALKTKKLRHWPVPPFFVFLCFFVLFTYAIIMWIFGK